MDQHATLEAATQRTPNVDSTDLASATSSSKSTTKAHGTGYFDFFGLPPEIRDMIYDLPQMLDHETPLSYYDDGWPKMAATKPRTSLLMVNSQFSSEYEKRCNGRSGLFVSETLDRFFYTSGMAGSQLSSKAAKGVSFMHIHAANWMIYEYLLGVRGFELFKQWISHYAYKMPKLQNISVNVYTNRHDFQDAGIRRSFIEQLDALTSVGQLTELRVVIMEDPWQWRSRHVVKELLVHWNRESDTPLQLIDPAVSYEEECCIGSFATSSDHEEASEEVGHTYPHSDSDDSEEDAEMRLSLTACGE